MTFLIAFSRSPESQADSLAHLGGSRADKAKINTFGNQVAVSWQPQHCATATTGAAGSRLVGIGRCRLDRKANLIKRLQRHGKSLPAVASDLHLAMLAHTAWGEDAVSYLQGDFALVIWHEATGRIFLARDRLGVNNLAYLNSPSRTWVSNSVDALAAVPDLDRNLLDNVWIANFLGKAAPDASARSVFTQLRRLAPAHRAVVSDGAIAISRYWSLNPQSPLHLVDPNEYLDRFHELLAQSISERSPDGRLGISLSGGLDSATLAAKAVETLGSPTAVCADTWVMKGEADPEFQASKTIARHLGIDHHITEASGLHFDPDWRAQNHFTAEPDWAVLYPGVRAETLRRMAKTADVWFYGEGPDNALTFEWRAYLEWLVSNKEWSRTALAVKDYLRTKSLSHWGQTMRSLARRFTGRSHAPLDSSWIKPSVPEVPTSRARSWRPRALANFNSGIWANFLEDLERDEFDHGITWRHPYLETELLEFMFRAPPIPWGRDKALIRRAMQGHLPDAILQRRKVPLYVDIYGPEFGAKMTAVDFPKGGMIEEFVDLSKLPASPKSGDETEAVLRVMILDRWLQSLAAADRT